MPVLRRVILRLHATVLAVFIPDLSKFLSLSNLLRFFTPRKASRFYHGVDEQTVVTMIQRLLQNPWRMRGRRCLRLGLLTFYFLRLAGIPAELRFGVYTTVRPRELAHCWVTLRGRCLTEPPQFSYVPILTWGESDDDFQMAAVPASIAAGRGERR